MVRSPSNSHRRLGVAESSASRSSPATRDPWPSGVHSQVISATAVLNSFALSGRCNAASGWSAGTARTTASVKTLPLLQPFGRPPRPHRPVVGDGDVAEVVGDVGGGLVGRGLPHHDLQVRMLPLQRGQRRRDRRRQARDGRDVQEAADPAEQRGQVGLGGLGVGEQRARMPGQQPAGVGEGRAARSALQEDGSGLAFQGGQLLRDGRRRVAQGVGRRRDAPGDAELVEDGETAQDRASENLRLRAKIPHSWWGFRLPITVL